MSVHADSMVLAGGANQQAFVHGIGRQLIGGLHEDDVAVAPTARSAPASQRAAMQGFA